MNTEGTRFATVRFTMIHFYDPCRARMNTPYLWCITVASQTSFLYLVLFKSFSGVHVFFFFRFGVVLLS
jgi:hypothetical protein